jgi:hypothetical protein
MATFPANQLKISESDVFIMVTEKIIISANKKVQIWSEV